MWDEILKKLDYLKELDAQHVVFGADRHHYVLRPCLSLRQIRATESRLGVSLPEALRAFYGEVGDGVAGPDYGLIPASQLEGFKANEPYPGIEFIRQSAGKPPKGNDYFEADFDVLAGLLPIIEQGCGHQVCLITEGRKTGKVVYVSGDGCVSETNDSMTDIYEAWLDREIAQFKALIVLMQSKAKFEYIQKKIDNAGDRIASIANIKRPASLFGKGNRKIYHGRSQFPWYQQVLEGWRNRGKGK